ncbi:hypothetical protein K491DRAFT_358441 [Lophiostoma macrostomum CBS 122681]|uniref:Uncharacterized protein n=1 Tax=Lophiostoma macrostomum CBS 122681 TaxID=1314788 RepID=A0A6A6TBX3_9PLEO|nr:hypothetical protein K491DRAFT_358441 [Lophiostoma macrostomum CBS 122681]
MLRRTRTHLKRFLLQPSPPPPLSRRASVESVHFCRCLPCFYGYPPSRGAAMFRHDPSELRFLGASISCAIISCTCSLTCPFYCSISSTIIVSVPCQTIPFSLFLVHRLTVTEPALVVSHSIFAFSTSVAI